MHPTQGSPIVAEKPLGRRIGLQDLAGFGVGDQNGVLSRFEKGTVQRFLLQPRRLTHFHTDCCLLPICRKLRQKPFPKSDRPVVPCQLHQTFLKARCVLAAPGPAQDVPAVGSQLPGRAVIFQGQLQQTRQPPPELRVFDRRQHLDAVVQIAPHPVALPM